MSDTEKKGTKAQMLLIAALLVIAWLFPLPNARLTTVLNSSFR